MTYSDDQVHEQLTIAAGAVRSAFSTLPIPDEVAQPRRPPQLNLAAAALVIAIAGVVALLVASPGSETTEVVATRYVDSEAPADSEVPVDSEAPIDVGSSGGAGGPADDDASPGTGQVDTGQVDTGQVDTGQVDTAQVVETPTAETQSGSPTAVAETSTSETAPAAPTDTPNQPSGAETATPAPGAPVPVTPVATPTPAPETPTPEPDTTTPVAVPTPTSAPLPTSTPVPEPTPTSAPLPTATPVPAPTSTPVPAPTSTPVPAPIPTVVPEFDICYGAINTVIQIAKANYTAACGITYSDTSGVHQCVWTDAGWRCHGPRADGHQAAPGADSASSATSNPAPTASAAPEPDLCFGAFAPDIQTAKANYTAACGIIYSDTSGVHQCVWSDEGWRCHGPRAGGARSQ